MDKKLDEIKRKLEQRIEDIFEAKRAKSEERIKELEETREWLDGVKAKVNEALTRAKDERSG